MPENNGAPLTLTEFLEKTRARLHWYDMGRRVVPISRTQFLAFEQGLTPYPYPMQQKAWFALVQQHPETADAPVIWFLRFELDEQAKLVLATRDYLIHRFVEIASAPTDDTDLGEAMQDNPFAFAPGQEKMANLHAIVHRDLGLAPSQYYAHARDYLGGKPGWEQWTFVAYQGLADFAARLDEPDNTAILSEALPHLPDEPLVALGHCLENHAPPPAVADSLNQRLQAALQDPQASVAVLAALVRALSRTEGLQLLEHLQHILRDPRSSDPEILAAIGGRAWDTLESPVLAKAYLERLSDQEVGQDIFTHCVSDLLRMPQLQQKILAVLRDPERSPRLASAFQHLLQR